MFDPSEDNASRMAVLEKFPSLSTLMSVPQDVMQEVPKKYKLAKQRWQGKGYTVMPDKHARDAFQGKYPSQH